MGEWLVAVKVDVLVSVCGFAVNVKVEGAVRIPDDGDIKHSNFAAVLNFFRPLHIGVDRVEILMERLDMVFVDANDGVVGLTVPELDDVAGTDVAVASGIIGKGSSLKVLHENVGQRAAGGFAHAKSLELLVKLTLPLEIGLVEI